ncbi:MAG: hypothetical protein BWY63_01665 [Chloroflexi bacterium ADurb.Bin360]|nr:MAG: hypothetical protein BWY63_01665 [Chloroflexi bacterium ADurb.Bin360]
MNRNLFQRLVLNLHPERYHGHGKRSPFFEGWYFKLIDATEQQRHAIIPGVSLANKGIGPHAFVQVFDGICGEAHYIVYPLSEFWAANDAFSLKIGPNCFTRDTISLDITDELLTARGELHFTGGAGWPITLTAPGIMGWYAWVPFMECYHGVLSFDHHIEGSLTVKGVTHDFTGGRGYIEKDWGQAFPSTWLWQQSNHFHEAHVSLSASIAIIPWLRSTFRGFIVGLWRDGTLYRFATYTGALTEKLEIGSNHVHWVLSDRLYRLEMHAQRAQATELRGPTIEDMDRRVPETLTGTVAVQLTARANGGVIFKGLGRNAGMEAVGDLDRLMQ